MEGYRSRGILRLHPVERGPRQPIDDRRLAQALEMFNKGEGGFKDRDLYVWCANASDGILTAHPTNKGKELRDIEGKEGAPFGQEIMKKAAEGTIKEVTYWWPRPGSDKPLEKTTFYTKSRLLQGMNASP
jgi:Single Cache domain 2